MRRRAVNLLGCRIMPTTPKPSPCAHRDRRRPIPDNYQVIRRGLPIGRIMKQSGAQFGKQEWWFSGVAMNSNSMSEITRLADMG
jgi:hypothetical protein